MVLAIYFCIPYFREWEALPPLWKYLTFTQNLGLDIRGNRTFSHAWSLCIEEQFYLVLPLTLIALVHLKVGRKGALLLASLFVFGFAARLYCWQRFVAPVADTDAFTAQWYKWIYYPTWGRLDGILCGVTIAALFQFFPEAMLRISKHGNKLVLLSLMLLSGAYWLCLDSHSWPASIFGFPLVSAEYGVMVAAAISPSCFLYKFRSVVTEKVAAWSFAIYLVHKGMIHIVQVEFVKSGLAADGNLMLLFCIAGSVAGALLLHFTIEQPFMKLRKKITG